MQKQIIRDFFKGALKTIGNRYFLNVDNNLADKFEGDDLIIATCYRKKIN